MENEEGRIEPIVRYSLEKTTEVFGWDKSEHIRIRRHNQVQVLSACRRTAEELYELIKAPIDDESQEQP